MSKESGKEIAGCWHRIQYKLERCETCKKNQYPNKCNEGHRLLNTP